MRELSTFDRHHLAWFHHRYHELPGEMIARFRFADAHRCTFFHDGDTIRFARADDEKAFRSWWAR